MTKFTLPEGATQKPKRLHERESAIEGYLVKRTKARGEIAYKFTSPQRRSVPDRLVLGNVRQAAGELEQILALCGVEVDAIASETLDGWVTAIVARMVHFAELKATGAKPTELQEREHAKLRERGFVVRVIDSKEGVDRGYPK